MTELLVTGACDPQNLSILARRLNVPELAPFLVLVEDAGPSQAQLAWQFPAQHLVIEPDTYEVAGLACPVLERLAPMQDTHVVDEAQVALEHARLDLEALRGEVHGVESLSLKFSQGGDAGATRIEWLVSDQEPAREGGDELAMTVVHESSLVEWRVATESVMGRIISREFESVAGNPAMMPVSAAPFVLSCSILEEDEVGEAVSYVSNGQFGSARTWMRSGRVAASSL